MILSFSEISKLIRNKRQDLGWSQRELAKKAGVSKTVVSQLELQKSVPNYENVRKIYLTVEKTKTNDPVEEDVNEEIWALHPNDKIRKAKKIMKEKDFSQIPIAENKEYIGIITENNIAEINNYKKPVKEVMNHSLPTIEHDTPEPMVLRILDTHKAVLVKKDDEIIGMVTPSDIM